ncbi:hypothetical protein [Catenuloplanes indicus]|uniref:Uncharacterized protein n=1 Tax=Catenuloplanes indicus TaxID=137267 RepID=A0AAE4AWA2_9ACTN|nr:hypothetical protein [Catenuloplanes indicus]MDQ0365730.1 hypothetical protein [Catenuloplanes indicus]
MGAAIVAGAGAWAAVADDKQGWTVVAASVAAVVGAFVPSLVDRWRQRETSGAGAVAGVGGSVHHTSVSASPGVQAGDHNVQINNTTVALPVMPPPGVVDAAAVDNLPTASRVFVGRDVKPRV